MLFNEMTKLKKNLHNYIIATTNITGQTSIPSKSAQDVDLKLQQQNDLNLEKAKQAAINSLIENNELTSLYSNDKINGLKLNNNCNVTDASGKYCVIFFIEFDNKMKIHLFAARLSKINLYDDNSSFFSRSPFHSFKFDGINGSESNNQNMTSTHLPDLLNGTLHNNNNLNGELDPKQLLKNLAGFGNSHMYMNGEFLMIIHLSRNFRLNCNFNLR